MTIQERMNSIRNKFRIEDVISRYTDLEEKGSYLRGCCPFETDKSHTSFTVSPIKQIFFCFNCQKGGDVITFLAEQEPNSQQRALLSLEKEWWKKTIAQIAQRMRSGELSADDPIIEELQLTHKNLLDAGAI